ncbi:MAG TPA: RHS repeat-associated core domain-containing protein [Micromonosporaceae bacterium]|nr:RHS repeat-associated core domain-containing protein [Micromonosporaceae bacterium]
MTPRSSCLRRATVATLPVVLVASLLGQQPARATEPDPVHLAAQQVPSVHGTVVQPRPRPAGPQSGAPRPAPPVWPAAGTAELVVPSRAGNLPVSVERPAAAGQAVSSVRVTLLDRATLPARLRDGLVLRLLRTDGAATPGRIRISVDYSAFASARGADWSSRLRLVSVAECALREPIAAGCPAGTPLASTNNPRPGRVSADVSLSGEKGGTFVVLTAGASGAAGDFAATSLQASSTWSAGGNSGDFSWSYPMRVPPSLGGPAPSLALAYSSSSVDGRSEATNNQPSWVGEGFDWWPGYVERRYKPCATDLGSGANNTIETGDLCWGTDNATMSLNGSGGELIRDGATGTWRLKNDDASKVERLTGAINGANGGEYWRITGSDGTQYYFGLNRLPGYTGTAPANKTTSSTWTVPVAGNHTGEPCHAASFLGSFCNQAWRWNLDYVVDLHGNTMSLFYTPETNKYARNNTDSDDVSYIRGGVLERIDYGTDKRSGTDTENTATPPPMRVTFTPSDRCLSACWNGTDPNEPNWYDTPWDQYCKASNTSCVLQYSPTFWTSKRLTGITTWVWNIGAPAPRPVDGWTLTHTFPSPGDGTRAGLWLASIVHTGKATGSAVLGTEVAMPAITFDWVQMPNRVDSLPDGKFPMNWMRINTIWADAGGKIKVDYTGPDCIVGVRMPSSPQNNTLRCYPVREEQPDHSIQTEYFHKYLVTKVTESDWTGGGPDIVTSYEYVGTPAWRHTDDDGITRDNLRTWSDFRGYGQVNTRVGDPGSGTETLSETVFFRGMHGDLDGAGGTRTIVMQAIDGNGDGDTADTTTADAPAVNDENTYTGMARLSTVYNGVESAPLSRTVNEPWQSAPTATRDMGDTIVYARHVGTRATWAGTKLTAGWRVTRLDTTYDNTYGMVTQTDDQGDVAVSGDEECSKTTYGRNVTANLLTLPSQVETYALRCSGSAISDADVVGMTRNLFDHQAAGAAPTIGEITGVDIAKSWTQAGGPVWLTTSTTNFDIYGRPVDAADVRGNHTTVAYTPSTGGPITSRATTSSFGTTTDTLEPAWGAATTTVDVNGKQTDLTYDALGRITQVWLPNHLKASFASQPNTSYSYLIRNTGGVNAVTTRRLNAAGNYVTSYTLYDGMLRARQTQSLSAANGNVGTVFTETKYDPIGRVSVQSQHFDATVQPSTTLFTIANWLPKTQTTTQYDRASRTIASIFDSGGVEQWRTTVAYTGDRVNTTPPLGGTATTAVSDAHGRVTELRQYKNRSDVGSDTRSLYDLATYHFNRKGQQDSVTDNAGNTWTSGSDFLGRPNANHDPDSGDSSRAYNDYGDVLTTTDGRGQLLAYMYDSLGRRTAEYAGSIAPANKLASWAYDPVGAKGYPASSSRWTAAGTTEYKVVVRGYSPLYQSIGEDYVIPAAETGLGGTYTFTRTFNVDGSPATTVYPNKGGLPAETLTYHYDAVTGLPEYLQTNWPNAGNYVSNTDYTTYGETSLLEYQMTAGNWLQRGLYYEDSTHRLAQATTTRQITPQYVADVHYTYDAVGNVKKIADTPAGGTADTQCFEYDYALRLAEAWTPADGNCDATKAATDIGPAPYWTSWEFDAVGNRKTETVHTTSGQTTTTYTYPAAGSNQPHAVTSTTGPVTQNYRYDAVGNTTCRPSGSGTNTCPPGTGSQTLSWDAEGRLATVDGTNSYLYTAEGVRLIERDSTGTTLYLPGEEIRRSSGGTVTTTRYYAWADGVCAMRQNGTIVSWLVGDHQGTQQISIHSGTQAVTQRRQTPYGTIRGTNPTWPNKKGFVGGDNDPTGLTHIGAREYDPKIGRFISVDPVFNAGDPQSWTGYAYANNTPITGSDPTGLMYDNTEHEKGDCNKDCQEAVALQDEKRALENEKEEAEKTTKMSLRDIIIMAGLAFLLDLFGVTDIWNCISRGQIKACANALIGSLPVGKILKAGKAIFKGIMRVMDAYKVWKKAVKLAEAVIKRTSDAIAATQKKLDDILRRLHAKGGGQSSETPSALDKLKALGKATGKQALRSGGASFLIEAWIQSQPGAETSGTDLLTATLGGAVGGATGGLLSRRTNPVIAGGIGGVIGGSAESLVNELSGDDGIDATNILIGATWNGAFGASIGKGKRQGAPPLAIMSVDSIGQVFDNFLTD